MKFRDADNYYTDDVAERTEGGDKWPVRRRVAAAKVVSLPVWRILLRGYNT